MLSRFEYDVRSGMVTEVFQVVYQSDEGSTLVLDKSEEPPHGFTEFTGDLSELSEEEAMAGEEKPAEE